MKDKSTDATLNASHIVKDEIQAAEGRLSHASGEANDQTLKVADFAEEKTTDEDKKQVDSEKDEPRKESSDKEEKKDEREPKQEEDVADASAYEVNPDLPKTEDEVKAEEKLQPNRA